jgi:hypothetical protein
MNYANELWVSNNFQQKGQLQISERPISGVAGHSGVNRGYREGANKFRGAIPAKLRKIDEFYPEVEQHLKGRVYRDFFGRTSCELKQ